MIRSSLTIVAVEEILRLRRSGVMEDSFTTRELRSGNPISLAGKLAAKRAVCRAVAHSFPLADLEISREFSAKPSAIPSSPSLRRAFRALSVHVSISHTKTLAAAVCIATTTEKNKPGLETVEGRP